MSNFLISFILAAGAGALVYSQIGKRVGYGNTQRVWILVISTFLIVLILLLITFTWVIHFK